MRISDSKIKYSKFCSAEKGNCPGTVKKKLDSLNKIIHIVGDIDVSEIDQHTTLDLKEKLIDEKLSDARIASIISTLKDYMKYQAEFMELRVYDYSKITIPRVKSKPVETLSVKQIDELIEGLSDKSLKDKRQKGLTAMLADTGARINELLNLKRDIDLQSGEAVVLGKGNKFRVIYWGERTKKYVQNYLDTRPEWDESPYLFGTVNKGNYGGRWDSGDVNGAFRRLSKKLNKRIHCHLFRSSFLTNCLHQGLNLSAVSKAMGHSDIRTSMRYFAPMSDENTEVELEKFFRQKATIQAKANMERREGV